MADAMRILLTADTVGGVWTYTVELARALASRKVRIALATMGAPLSTGQRKQLELLPHVSLYESTLKLEWMDHPWDDVQRAGDWLLDIEREFSPDVVHLNGYAHGALPFAAPQVVVGHSCVCSWWQACRGEPAPGGWDRYRETVSRGLQSANLVVTPTNAMLNALRRHYGPLPTARVIANGRDPAGYRPAPVKEPMVLSAGRLWDEAKNLTVLDAAAAGLPWPVYVAGENRHPGGGQVSAGSATLLGVLDEAEMARWFGRAAIYALPARYEPFGLSVLEAALAGCALVLGDIPSLRENWDGAAEFVAPDDPAGLHRVITQLAENPSRRNDLAARATGRAARFNPGAFADGYALAYRQMMTESRPRLVADIAAPNWSIAPCAS